MSDLLSTSCGLKLPGHLSYLRNNSGKDPGA